MTRIKQLSQDVPWNSWPTYSVYIHVYTYIYTIYIIQSNCFTMFHLSSLFASSRAETVIIKSNGANEVRDCKPSSKPSGKPSLQRQQSRLNLLSLSDVEPLAACPGTRHCGELSKTKCQEPSSTVCKSTKTVMTCICHFVIFCGHGFIFVFRLLWNQAAYKAVNQSTAWEIPGRGAPKISESPMKKQNSRSARLAP
jgi:hypothetical protein